LPHRELLPSLGRDYRLRLQIAKFRSAYEFQWQPEQFASATARLEPLYKWILSRKAAPSHATCDSSSILSNAQNHS
jgi:hypothetical protein